MTVLRPFGTCKLMLEKYLGVNLFRQDPTWEAENTNRPGAFVGWLRCLCIGFQKVLVENLVTRGMGEGMLGVCI